MNDRPPFRSWVEDYPHDSRAMPPIDREAFRIRAVQRGKNARTRAGVASGKAAGTKRGSKISRVRQDHQIMSREVAFEQAAALRATDLIERARLHLQRRGYRIVRASMFGGKPDHWDIAGRDRWISNEELLALAERQGFTKEGNAGV